ncbi:MAG: ABC transporter permease [Anaerolineae bacterium]|nr:ABC transporter permease [Anaerolineae bacterium]
MATLTTHKPVRLMESDNQRKNSNRALRRFLRHRGAVFGAVLLVFVIGYVILGSLLFSESYANFNDTSRRLQPPSTEHPMGTDNIGRDIFARTVYGGQISLMIGFLAVTVAVLIGTTVGVVTGYFGGWIDVILMRLTEAMLSIPTLLFLLMIANIFGGKVPQIALFGRVFSGSVVVIIVIIGLTSWMGLSRIVRSLVLSLKEAEFITAARALGASDLRLIFKHILPNIVAPVVVSATLGVGGAILSESYISFLGVGVGAPTATWGNILEGSRQFFEQAPWLWVAPGILILMTVMGINFLGDGLRDALDPRSDKSA